MSDFADRQPPRSLSRRLVTRVPRLLVEEVDALVSRGEFSSRSEAVRAGLELITLKHSCSYREPLPIEDHLWSDERSAQMIAEEPWESGR